MTKNITTNQFSVTDNSFNFSRMLGFNKDQSLKVTEIKSHEQRASIIQSIEVIFFILLVVGTPDLYVF